jgi:hypothetical protein
VRVELLETEMRRRALVGWDEPVFHAGKVVGHVRKFSDALLIFALKRQAEAVTPDRHLAKRNAGRVPVIGTVPLTATTTDPTR